MTKKNWDPLLATDGSVVGFYERFNYCFSNFSAFAVEDEDGNVWMTSEHMYQAEKFRTTAPEVFQEILRARSAHEAKRIAAKNIDLIVEGWFDGGRDSAMLRILTLKVKQHPFIQNRLLQTGDQIIVEDSPNDNYWGWGPNRNGQNVLGNLWMEVREKLRTQLNRPTT